VCTGRSNARKAVLCYLYDIYGEYSLFIAYSMYMMISMVQAGALLEAVLFYLYDIYGRSWG
jgi:predicted transcriptional regulator with HTH domain